MSFGVVDGFTLSAQKGQKASFQKHSWAVTAVAFVLCGPKVEG